MSGRDEDREQTPAGDVVPPRRKPPLRSRRRADAAGAARPERPPNALGPFIPEAAE
jgi:hypothetical protein